MESKSFLEIVDAVGVWSQKNFNRNVSKANGQVLFEIPSVLGLGEEGGELCHCLLIKDTDGAEDSLADIGIYLSDFLYRTNLLYSDEAREDEIRQLLDCCLNATSWSEMDHLQKEIIESIATDELLGKSRVKYIDPNQCMSLMELGSFIVSHIGGIQHAMLKQHQGIRGMDNQKRRNVKLIIHVLGVLVGCIKLNTRLNSGNYIETMNHVYFNVVEKRDWTKNATTGE